MKENELSTIRFIVYEDYDESRLMSEFKDLDIKAHFDQVTEDTVEVKTDKPDEVNELLSRKTLTYVAR